MEREEFIGSKIVVLCDDEMIVYLTDDKPDIPYPNCWDLPGGGREGDETPEQCALRETKEEFGLDISPNRILWKKRYPGLNDRSKSVYFLVAAILPAELELIAFGDEGQRWRMIKVDEFLSSDDFLPAFKDRFQEFLDSHRK